MLNIPVIKAHPASAKQIAEGDYWQAILDVSYDAWQQNPTWQHRDMIEVAVKAFGPAVKLFIMLGNYNYQVCNGGHIQYFDNGYASNGGGCMKKHDTDCENHAELVKLFRECKLSLLPGGLEILNILEAFHIEVDEESQITESCHCGHDDECEDCEGRGEFETDNPEYGCVSNTSELDKLDKRYYAVYEAFEKQINLHLKEWFATGVDPLGCQEAQAVPPAVPKKPIVKLIGQDGNAFNLLGIALKALRDSGYSQEQLAKVQAEAMAGDYNNLLNTLTKYCDVR